MGIAFRLCDAVSRGVWSQAQGSLNRLSIGAARQLNRRALDSLFQIDIVAVGTLKISVDPVRQGRPWRAEIHQVVAGVTRKDLERIFATRKPSFDDFVWVEKVKNLGDTVSRVLRPGLHVWQHPSDLSDPAAPKKKARAECYLWLLGRHHQNQSLEEEPNCGQSSFAFGTPHSISQPHGAAARTCLGQSISEDDLSPSHA